ncbi:MAG TPA: bile acid:sodium symporter [Planctomycetaceae bacterium]|nr:bile acid:sodium symporter [Planctomycetaceae bacterium]
MRATLIRQWFLCALAVMLAGGLIAGCYLPAVFVEQFLDAIHPAGTTAVVLFLMSFSLDTSRLRDTLRDPPAVLWGAVVNMGLTPLIAWPLAILQARPDFSLGLMVAAISPCTLATASVFTRRAGGNDAISLLVTLLTNCACVVVSPLWLGVILSENSSLDLTGIMSKLGACVLLPTLLGQLAQWPPAGQALSRRHRGVINFVSQCLVLLLVLIAAMRGGLMLRDQPSSPAVFALVWLCGSCIAVHAASLAIGWVGARALRAPLADTIAVAFAGSQKTLPIALFIATQPVITQQDVPLITFPLLAFHAGQLLLDAMLADRWAGLTRVQSLSEPR